MACCGGRIFMLVGGEMSLRFRLIGLVCLVLLISLALGAAIAYSNASRSVRTEMRAALLVGRQTIENTVERLQTARDPLRDLDDLVASFNGNRHHRGRAAEGANPGGGRCPRLWGDRHRDRSI